MLIFWKTYIKDKYVIPSIHKHKMKLIKTYKLCNVISSSALFLEVINILYSLCGATHL